MKNFKIQKILLLLYIMFCKMIYYQRKNLIYQTNGFFLTILWILNQNASALLCQTLAGPSAF